MDFIAVFVILLYQTTTALTDNVNCTVSVDITDGIPVGNSIIHNGLTYDESNYYTSGSAIRGCICNIKKCVRKCCVEGEVLNTTTKSCVRLDDPAMISFSTYNIVDVPENEICTDEKIRVKVDDNFHISDGVLIWDGDQYAFEDYCVNKVENTTVALICVTVDQEMDRIVLCIGMIISMPFLLATFLVYAVLPESNLHRKSLMSYVLTLLIAYIFLVTIQLHNRQFPSVICQTLGYSVIFFFMVSFFWMNVMCIDMWFTFSGLRGFGKRDSEKKRFIFYCIYAWGTSIVHVIIVCLINTYGDQDKIYSPKIGVGKCFLDDGYPNLFYFYGPMSFLIAINVVLFILTAVKIQKVKKETSMLKQSDSKKHNYENDKQKFNLYLKLLFAMGINWTMEVISWAVNWKMERDVPPSVWYLTDFCNAMYGAFIFFIFVFKRAIWKSLQKRYYVFIGKPHLAHSMTMTQTTRSSNYSTTETGLSDHRLSELKNGRGEERVLTQN